MHHLSSLPCLEELYLRGNPIAHSPSYRCQVFGNLPNTSEQVCGYEGVRVWCCDGCECEGVMVCRYMKIVDVMRLVKPMIKHISFLFLCLVFPPSLPPSPSPSPLFSLLPCLSPHSEGDSRWQEALQRRAGTHCISTDTKGTQTGTLTCMFLLLAPMHHAAYQKFY